MVWRGLIPAQIHKVVEPECELSLTLIISPEGNEREATS